MDEERLKQVWWHVAFYVGIKCLFNEWALTCKTWYAFTKDSTVMKSYGKSIPDDYYVGPKSKGLWSLVFKRWQNYQKFVKLDKKEISSVQYQLTNKFQLICGLCDRKIIEERVLVVRGIIIGPHCYGQYLRLDCSKSLLNVQTLHQIQSLYGSKSAELVKVYGLSWSKLDFVIVEEMEQCLYENLDEKELKFQYSVWKSKSLVHNRLKRENRKRKRETSTAIDQILNNTFQRLKDDFNADDDLKSSTNMFWMYGTLMDINNKIRRLPSSIAKKGGQYFYDMEQILKRAKSEIEEQECMLEKLKKEESRTNSAHLTRMVNFWYGIMKRRGLVCCEAKLKNGKPCSYYNDGMQPYCKLHLRLKNKKK